MSANGSVFQMLQEYWNNGKRQLLYTNQLYEFLREVIEFRESIILRACAIQKKPELYERIIVLTLGYTNDQYAEK